MSKRYRSDGRAAGADTQKGFVPKTYSVRGMGGNWGFVHKTCPRCLICTCSLALVGATRGEVLVADMPMSPSSRAMSVYHWQMPKWFDRLAVTQPTPDDFALEMACFILENMISVLPRWAHSSL